MIIAFNILVALLDGFVGAYVLYVATTTRMKRWPQWVRWPLGVGAFGLICQCIRCLTFLITGEALGEYDQLSSWMFKDLGLILLILSITRNITVDGETSKSYFFKRVRWVKWALLLTASLSVILVDHHAGKKRANDSITESKRDLKMLWDVTSKLVQSCSMTALPTKEQEAWKSLDIYMVSADDKAVFMTAPRFEPVRTAVLKSLEESYDGRIIDCWTEPVKLARNGITDVSVHKDYRGLDVLSAFGLVTVDNVESVLLVELDVAESLSGSAPNYWDEIIVSLCCLAVGWIVFVVHRQKDSTDATITQLEAAAEEVINLNADLSEKLSKMEQSHE